MTDRAIRNLAHLRRSASTARVLNLLKIFLDHGHEADWKERPLFQTPAEAARPIVTVTRAAATWPASTWMRWKPASKISARRRCTCARRAAAKPAGCWRCCGAARCTASTATPWMHSAPAVRPTWISTCCSRCIPASPGTCRAAWHWTG